MAREVNATLGKIISAERGLTETQGEEIVKKLRNSNLYQVCLVPLCDFVGSVPFRQTRDRDAAATEIASSQHTPLLLFLRCTMES